MTPTLTHVRLLVSQYSACFRFYDELLGTEVTFGDEESGYADFDTGSVTLALFDAAEMADALGDGPGDPDDDRGRDQASLVLATEDVDETARQLRERGVDLVAPPTDHPEWGIRTVHVRDPDGTLVEFNEPLERS